MLRDDSKLCDVCYLRTPHHHLYLRRDNSIHGFVLDKVLTFYILDNKDSIEIDPQFLCWVDNEILQILDKHYKD